MEECGPSRTLAKFADQSTTRVALPETRCDSVDQATQARKLYKPIKPWQTRLLELAAGKDGEDIHARLLTVDIILADGVAIHDEGRQVNFEALSYTWGQPKFLRSLTVNGYMYPITDNLSHALHRLRHTSEPRLLWIDALCINQHDVAERSSQVAGIITIYRKASRVIVWLGEHGEYTEMCCRYLGHHAKWQDTAAAARERFSSSCHTHAVTLLEGLDDLLFRPWYSRVWVRQEVWAAQGLIVMCGSDCIHWDWIINAADVACIFARALRSPSEVERFETCAQHIKSLKRAGASASAAVTDTRSLGWHAGPLLLEDERRSIVHVIRDSNHCGCTDARDRIYGVLGMTTVAAVSARLVSRHRNSYLPIDYSRTISRVFTDLAAWVMTTQQDLDLLLLDGQFGGTVEGQSIPSWCPNWNQSFSLGDYLPNYKTLHASGKEELRIDNDVLFVRGVEIGTIEDVNVVHGTIEDANMVHGKQDIKYAWVRGHPLFTNRKDYKGFERRAYGAVALGDIVVRIKRCLRPLVLRKRHDEMYIFKGSINPWAGRRNVVDIPDFLMMSTEGHEMAGTADLYREFSIV